MTRLESLEERRLLHSDDGGPWLDHLLDDTALVNAAAVNPPVTAPLAAAQAAAAQPSSVGQWGALENFPIEFINAVMLPTGKALGYDRTLNLRLWDPSTNVFTTPASPGYNFFCSGIAMLADGSVLVTGGTVVNFVGVPFAAIYNPFTDTWTQTANMNDGRWYPSTTTLANGDALVLSGYTNGNKLDPLPEVYDYSTGTWRDLTTALQTLSSYPRTFSAPNGDAFVAGPDPRSEYLDTSGTGVWIPVADRVVPDRNYGSAVMYAPGKVLYVGGGSPAVASAEVIDLNQPNPTWRAVSPMAFARRNCTATLLPDGEVLVIGGNTGSTQYDGNDVMAAEIWNPQTEQFTTLSNMSDIRWYHSSALLLPDGRVLSTSGDTHLTGQVFSPPYLFQGAQPTITSAPATVEYGDNFLVATPDAANITSASWVRLGSSTHAQNWDQYFQNAAVTQTPGGVMVTAPVTPNASPPGYYMLFILKGNVPSVAKIIHVGQTLPTLTISDSSATEGPTGSTVNAVFTVSLSLASAQTVTVAYATADGTTVAGSDYTPQAGTLTFGPLVISQTITVPVLGDGIVEANETYKVNLSAPVNAGVVKAQGQGLIRDFNSVSVLQIAGPASVVEGDSGTANASYAVTLSAPSTTTVTVAYATADGTATAPSDYLAQSGVLTFNPGVTQQTILVPVVGDTIDEFNETFFVNLSAPVGATVDVAQAETLIYNNDAPPTVNLPEFATINEPTNGTANLVLTVTLSAPSGKTVAVPWIANGDGTAIAGRNFVAQAGKLTFNPGTTAQTITVTVLGDGVKMPDEAFSVSFQYELGNCNPGNVYTYCTIVNTDTVPAISLANASVVEGNAGTTPMVFTATLTAPVAQAVTVAYQTSAGTATANVDYIETAGVITFAANTTMQVFTVLVEGDTTAESNETFNVTLSNPLGAAFASNKAAGTIIDNDGAPVPAAPANLTVVAGYAAASLSWQASAGATSYSIYRATNTNGEGTTPVAIGITLTTFIDQGLVNGTTYYYRVTAVDSPLVGTNFEGSASNEVAIVPSSYDFSAGFFFGTTPGQVSGSDLLNLNGFNVEDTRTFGAALQLTDGGTNQTDSAFTKLPVNVSRFTTQFTFQQIPSVSYTNALADGMTFTIEGAGPTALGGPGGGLGYAGIANSVAVKFDLFDNAGEGVNSTGLYTNGTNPTALNSINLAGTLIDLHSGDLFNVGMTYDGTTLQVTITDTVTQATAMQTYTVNIPAIVGSNMAYVGFTAGTGGLTAVQKVLTWTIAPGLLSAPLAPANLAVSSASGTQVVLNWTNTDPNATSVLVERKTGLGGTYAQIGATTTATANTYTDSTVAAGLTYYYRVRASNNGSTSVYSNEVNATTSGAAPTLNFPTGFAGAASQFGFNGPTAKIVGSNLQLTDGGVGEGASIFALTPVNVANFNTQFSVQLLSGTAFTADGMTFAIQGIGPTALGGTGGRLGYAGIANSVAVKFDLYNNAGEGFDSTGLYTNGTEPNAVNSIDLTGTGIDLHSGHTFNVNMTYDGTTLLVTITDATTQATATQSYTVNIPAIVGASTAYVGFTGATGGLTAVQNVLNWTYAPSGAPPAQADLQITNSDGPTSAVPGSAIAYTIVVTNAGPSNVTGATVADTFPVTLASATFTATATGGATGFTASGSGAIGDTLNLPAASTITYIVHATVSSAATGTLANTASVTAPAGVTDTNSANNSVTDTDTLTPQADLQITNTDGQTSAVPGSAITYTIVVTNAGPSNVTGATVADTFPAALINLTYTATATGGATGFTASGSGNISNTVNLPAASTITYIVHATVSSAATGTLANTASVTAPAGVTDANTANNSVTDTDTLTPQADLQITNTDGQTSAVPGSAITYTIVVTNAGPSNVSGATVADTFPAALINLTYTATATGGATGFTASGSGNISNTVNLPAASTITYIVHATVNSTATGTLANTASVTAPAGVTDANTANNSVTDTDTIAGAATLNFPNGFTGTSSQFSFNGSSAKIVGSNLQLTSGATSQAASIFARTAVNVGRFTTSFNIQLLNGTNPSADGMTFTIQGAGLTARGGSGGGLGYATITKSVAVKFDLYNNSGEGPNSTGLYTKGATPTATNSVNLTGTGIDLHSGHVFNVSMVYDGTTLQVTITDTVTLAKATQSYTVNIPTIVGASTAFVGFTGATGGLTATQNVLNWTYTVTPAGAAPAAKAAAAVVTAATPTTTQAKTASTPTVATLSPVTPITATAKLTFSGSGTLMEVPTPAPKLVARPKAAPPTVHDAVIDRTLYWRFWS